MVQVTLPANGDFKKSFSTRFRVFPPRNGTFGVKKEPQVSIVDLKMVELAGVCAHALNISGYKLENGSKKKKGK